MFSYFMSKIENSHAKWYPLHVFGPHCDEQTVEVPHLRLKVSSNIRS